VLLRADDRGWITIRDGERVWDPLSFVKDARSLTPCDQQGQRVALLEELELLRRGNQSYRNRLKLWMKIAVRRQEERDEAIARVRELEALRCVCDEESGRHEDTCPVMLHEAWRGATEAAEECERACDTLARRAARLTTQRNEVRWRLRKAARRVLELGRANRKHVWRERIRRRHEKAMRRAMTLLQQERDAALARADAVNRENQDRRWSLREVAQVLVAYVGTEGPCDALGAARRVIAQAEAAERTIAELRVVVEQADLSSQTPAAEGEQVKWRRRNDQLWNELGGTARERDQFRKANEQLAKRVGALQVRLGELETDLDVCRGCNVEAKRIIARLNTAPDACIAAPENYDLDTLGKRHTLTEEGDCEGWCPACRENRASGRNPDGTAPKFAGRTCGECACMSGGVYTRGFCVKNPGNTTFRRSFREVYAALSPPSWCPGFELREKV
jgi:hypothetical protein